MDTFIVYLPDGEGRFLEVGTFSDRQLAIDNTPAGGHVEQVTESGFVIIYVRPA